MAGSIWLQSSLDTRPIVSISAGRQFDHFGVIEQAAVEPLDPLDPEEAATLGHLAEQIVQGGREAGGVALGRARQTIDQVLGQDAGILGEHGEEQAIEEVRDRVRVVASGTQSRGQGREVLSGPLGQLLAQSGRAQALGIGEDGAQDAQRLARIGRQIVEGEAVHPRHGVGEVGVDLEAGEIAHHQQRRVTQSLAVAVELRVGGGEVLALALVLPGEVVAHPDVGEALAALGLAGSLLEGVPLAGRVGVVGRGLAEHPAQVDEVLLRRGLLGPRVALPLRHELSRCRHPALLLRVLPAA